MKTKNYNNTIVSCACMEDVYQLEIQQLIEIKQLQEKCIKLLQEKINLLEFENIKLKKQLEIKSTYIMLFPT